MSNMYADIKKHEYQKLAGSTISQTEGSITDYNNAGR